MSWYLKRSGGGVYGPVDLAVLETWATDGRVAPEDQLSEDQQSWIPAHERPELAMDWVVDLNGGSSYGPLHLLALRDFLQDGAISRRSRITHKQSGESTTVSEALVPVIMAREVKLQSIIDSLTARLEEAEKKVAKPAMRGSEASEREKQLGREIEVLTRIKDDFQQKMQKWENLCATEKANALKREEQLRKDLEALKSGAAAAKTVDEAQPLREQLDAERAAAQQREQRLQKEIVSLKAAAETAPGKWEERFEEEQSSARDRENRLNERIRALQTALAEKAKLHEQTDKWKKLYEQARDAAKTQQAKIGEAPAAAPGTDAVPRSKFEETERKRAQVERSYRQLMRTLNRNLNPTPRGNPTSSPDNLRRRDVS
jgi:hypothetical protein